MNDFEKAVRFKSPEKMPVNVDILPAAWIAHREKLHKIAWEYTDVTRVPDPDTWNKYDYVPRRYRKGTLTDEWGCVWTNEREGLDSICTGHPLIKRKDVMDLVPPAETAQIYHGFFFQKLMDLRGFEGLMLDFAEEPAELQLLIEAVYRYVLRQVDERKYYAKHNLAFFGDDLGTQTGTFISPRMMRKWIIPFYTQIYRNTRMRGKLIFMHSDGRITDIIPDLIGAGVDILNVQGGMVNFPARIAEVMDRPPKNRICIDYGLDRQQMYTEGYEPLAEVAVAREHLADDSGGLWLRAEIGPDVPLENARRIFEALRNCRKNKL